MLTLKKLKRLLKTQPIENYTNWLYQHPKVLSQINVLTGEQVLTDLKQLTVHKIEKSYYAGAMASLRKLYSVSEHPDGFYDEQTFEFIPLKLLRQYIMKSK